MSIRGKAYIAGIYEHPERKITSDISVTELHAKFARGALADAGLSISDVDAYFCATDAPGFSAVSMAEYMGIKLRHLDNTETGGSAYIVHVGHAAEAIAAGKCKVALITQAARPRPNRSGAGPHAAVGSDPLSMTPELAFEMPYGTTIINLYALAAMRHMHEYGTTSEQLAWIKVAASHHAQYNPNAALPKVVTVEDVLNSPMIADPLHRLDCCLNTEGGGAIVMVSPEIAKSLNRPRVRVLGAAEAPKHMTTDPFDLTYSAARFSAPPAFAEAGVTPADIKCVTVYDSFTITVLMQLEDLGFCEKGKGGAFVADGNLISGVGKLPVNTDGGGLCNSHPGGKGGLMKLLEATRQLRGEAHPKVQVPNCDLALAHGTGGFLGTRHVGATVILERE